MRTVFIIALLSVLGTISCDEKQGIITVDLYRQLSPREQYSLYVPQLKKYKLIFDKWLGINDSVPIYRYADNELYGKINIGKPEQAVNVAFDTAWSTSWVLSSRCSKLKPGCMFHNMYNHNLSSSYKKDGRPFDADGGTYKFSGFYSYDNISLGQTNVPRFSFVEMTSVPDSMFLNKADGVIGLGTQYGDYEPFFYSLYRQKKIRNPIFSIYLNSDRKSNNGGSIMLGYIDEKFIHKTRSSNNTLIPDKIKYLPVDDGGVNWQFPVDSIIINQNQSSRMTNVTLCKKGCKAITDTSSNDIFGPVEDINKILTLINAKKFLGKWTVKCNAVEKLPRIDFILGGQKFSLNGTQYITEISYLSVFKICVAAFTPTVYSSDETLWILGGAFLSQYYSIYNIEEKNIGFVKSI